MKKTRYSMRNIIYYSFIDGYKKELLIVDILEISISFLRYFFSVFCCMVEIMVYEIRRIYEFIALDSCVCLCSCAVYLSMCAVNNTEHEICVN